MLSRLLGLFLESTDYAHLLTFVLAYSVLFYHVKRHLLIQPTCHLLKSTFLCTAQSINVGLQIYINRHSSQYLQDLLPLSLLCQPLIQKLRPLVLHWFRWWYYNSLRLYADRWRPFLFSFQVPTFLLHSFFPCLVRDSGSFIPYK